MSRFQVLLNMTDSNDEETFLSEITFSSNGTPGSSTDNHQVENSNVLVDTEGTIFNEANFIKIEPSKQKALSMIKEVTEGESIDFNEHQLQTDFEELSLNTTSTSGNINKNNAQWHSTPTEKGRKEPNVYCPVDHSRVIDGNLFNETAHLLENPQNRGHLWSRHTKTRVLINVLLLFLFLFMLSVIIFALKYLKKF